MLNFKYMEEDIDYEIRMGMYYLAVMGNIELNDYNKFIVDESLTYIPKLKKEILG